MCPCTNNDYLKKKWKILLCLQQHPHVHRSIIYNSQDMEQLKHPWMNEWIKKMWCIYANRKLFHWNRRGRPWWHSGWESACQCRGHGFEPWSGKIPHVAEQLGPWATITEPAHLEPVLHNKRGRDSDRPVHHDEEWSPLAATRKSPRTETKTQHNHK